MGCVESSRVETVEHGNVQTDTSDQADAQRDGPPALAQSLLDQSELERGEAVHKHKPRRFSFRRFGFFMHYFMMGVAGNVGQNVSYGVLQGYLNVPPYVYNSSTSAMALATFGTFFFGMLSDAVPICGYRRKPWMAIGWAVAAIMLIYIAVHGLPLPFWCNCETGHYKFYYSGPQTHNYPIEFPDTCQVGWPIKRNTRGVSVPPCSATGPPVGPVNCSVCTDGNPGAADEGGWLILMLAIASLGTRIAAAGADGLLAQYALLEPKERRGATQVLTTIMTDVGTTLSALYVGVALSTPQFNGTFDFGLTFSQYMVMPAVLCALMVPLCLLCVDEPLERNPVRVLPGSHTRCGYAAAYMTAAFGMLKSGAISMIVVYTVLTSVISNIQTPVLGIYLEEWIKLGAFQRVVAPVLYVPFYVLALWWFQKSFLQLPWRRVVLITGIISVAIDAFFKYPTMFGYFRNQYFALSDGLVETIPTSIVLLVLGIAFVEHAPKGLEALWMAILSSSASAANTLGGALSNQIFRLFKPSLNDYSNWVDDTPVFRRTVFMSYLLQHTLTLLQYTLLPMLPSQKDHVHQRLRTWPKSSFFAVGTIILVFSAFAYGAAVLVLVMFPSTMCLKFAGCLAVVRDVDIHDSTVPRPGVTH